MSRPTDATSNYGWALWHLEQAEVAPDVAVATLHATCAQARATLYASDSREGRFEGSTWSASNRTPCVCSISTSACMAHADPPNEELDMQASHTNDETEAVA